MNPQPITAEVAEAAKQLEDLRTLARRLLAQQPIELYSSESDDDNIAFVDMVPSRST